MTSFPSGFSLLPPSIQTSSNKDPNSVKNQNTLPAGKTPEKVNGCATSSFNNGAQTQKQEKFPVYYPFSNWTPFYGTDEDYAEICLTDLPPKNQVGDVLEGQERLQENPELMFVAWKSSQPGYYSIWYQGKTKAERLTAAEFFKRFPDN